MKEDQVPLKNKKKPGEDKGEVMTAGLTAVMSQLSGKDRFKTKLSRCFFGQHVLAFFYRTLW